jgi:hypothetical protein
LREIAVCWGKAGFARAFSVTNSREMTTMGEARRAMPEASCVRAVSFALKRKSLWPAHRAARAVTFGPDIEMVLQRSRPDEMASHSVAESPAMTSVAFMTRIWIIHIDNGKAEESFKKIPGKCAEKSAVRVSRARRSPRTRLGCAADGS